MFKEKKLNGAYIEYAFWDTWQKMLFAIELGPEISKGYWSFTFSITIFYRVLVYVQYTKFKSTEK